MSDDNVIRFPAEFDSLSREDRAAQLRFKAIFEDIFRRDGPEVGHRFLLNIASLTFIFLSKSDPETAQHIEKSVTDFLNEQE